MLVESKTTVNNAQPKTLGSEPHPSIKPITAKNAYDNVIQEKDNYDDVDYTYDSWHSLTIQSIKHSINKINHNIKHTETVFLINSFNDKFDKTSITVAETTVLMDFVKICNWIKQFNETGDEMFYNSSISTLKTINSL